MRILIATGIYPPSIGGPAQYAVGLKQAFEASGHIVHVLTYGRLEHILPLGLRHVYIFLRAIFAMPRVDLLIALDTISAGLPATLAAKILGVRSVVRLGGDFLWETYVERTQDPLILPDFYAHLHRLSHKEKLIFRLQKFLLRLVDVIVFSTDWQARLSKTPYGLSEKPCHIIENAYTFSPKNISESEPLPDEKIFLWAGRPITLKNLPLLKQAFEEVKAQGISVSLECVSGVSHGELMDKVRGSYAVILPSFSDVSPNFILDGIHAGKPFIMTQHTGIRERLKGAGIFIDPMNKEEIVSAVVSLCQEKTYRECQATLNTLSYSHTYEDIAKEFLTLATQEG